MTEDAADANCYEYASRGAHKDVVPPATHRRTARNAWFCSDKNKNTMSPIAVHVMTVVSALRVLQEKAGEKKAEENAAEEAQQAEEL